MSNVYTSTSVIPPWLSTWKMKLLWSNVFLFWQETMIQPVSIKILNHLHIHFKWLDNCIHSLAIFLYRYVIRSLEKIKWQQYWISELLNVFKVFYTDESDTMVVFSNQNRMILNGIS